LTSAEAAINHDRLKGPCSRYPRREVAAARVACCGGI
jgi:hypothetical protein